VLKFYYNPVSGNSRRVWIALIEKKISFELVVVRLDGDHFGSNFTAVNPLQRVPVIVDSGFRVIESLAILDYLESKYPMPSLMPMRPKDIATVKMVEMLVINELHPAVLLLTCPLVGLAVEHQKLHAARERITTVMQFYENLLGHQPYFVGEEITLADIVAGISVSFLEQVDFSLEDYPHLKAWIERLMSRESWQQTTPSQDVVAAALPNIRKILERRM
jgi:glutathione S-transferase